MPENEIPEDLKRQVDAAMNGSKDTLNSPAEGTISQPVPDAPADMSNVPDPYDVKEQEAFRAGKREQAVEARDAAPEPQGTPESVVETPVGELSESSYEAMLEAAQQYKDATGRKEVKTVTPEAAADAAAPERDASLEPSPKPQAPEIDKE